MKHFLFALITIPCLLWIHFDVSPLVGAKFNRRLAGEKQTKPAQPPTWWNGGLQAKWEKSIRDEAASFPFALRLRNQLRWELFGELQGTDIIHADGKPWLWVSEVVKRLWPRQEKQLEEVLDNWAVLERWMASQGKSLYFIVNANKHWAFENEEWSRATGKCVEDLLPRGVRFGQFIQQELGRRDLDAFVVGPWLSAVHDTSRAPMWPRNGIHCSVASAELIVDSVMRDLSELWGMPLPKRISLGGRWEAEAQYADNDKGNTCNLLWDLPADSLWYPDFSWDLSKSPRDSLPRVMRIGDSFGNQLHAYGGLAAAFHPESRRFHYNREEKHYGIGFYQTTNLKTAVTGQVLMEELRRSDALIVDYSESTFLVHSSKFFKKIDGIMKEAKSL